MMKQQRHHNHNGFTLIEILLSLALIGIIAAVATPIYQSLQVRNDLDIVTVTVVQGLRRAQLLAEAQNGDTDAGVYVGTSSIIVFQGTSFASRVSDEDEIFSIPPTLVASGTTEFVFTKFTGLPASTGAISLTSTASETRMISINEEGTVTY